MQLNIQGEKEAFSIRKLCPNARLYWTFIQVFIQNNSKAAPEEVREWFVKPPDTIVLLTETQ